MASDSLTFGEYEEKALLTKIGFGDKEFEYRLLYNALALNGEAGEVAEKVKKLVRDGGITAHDIANELGDCLWYMTSLARELGLTLNDVAWLNVNKVTSRQERELIHGDGDDR